MSTTAIILAADPGDGFVAPKYLTPIRGVPLVRSVVLDALEWPVDEVVVVLGADAEEVAGTIDSEEVTILIDPDWEEGGASPLRAALDLVSRDGSIDLVVLARGDQPGVTGTVVSALLETARSSDADAVIPKYRYARSWPVVARPELWQHFLGLEGDVDVLDVVTAHARTVEEVWFDHLAPPVVETPQDAARPGR